MCGMQDCAVLRWWMSAVLRQQLRAQVLASQATPCSAMSASSACSLGAGSESAAGAAPGSAPGEAASAAASAGSAAAAPGCATVLLAPGCIAAAPTGAFRPADLPSGLNKKIAELKAEQARCLEQKKQLAKDLRNAERKCRHIKDRPRQLTDETWWRSS